MSDFPVVLTNAVDGIPGVGTPILAKHLNNLEAKVGVDASAVSTSLDYLLKNTASIDPGHKHSGLWASDGSPQAVTVDAAGNVVIGSTALNNSLLTIFSVDDGSFAHGLVLIDKEHQYGSWQNPSGFDGITTDVNGVPAGLDGRLYFNYYSSGNCDFNVGGGNSLFEYNVLIGGSYGIGTGGFGVLALIRYGATTGPSSSPQDTVQLYAADRGGVAGKSTLYMRTEDGQVGPVAISGHDFLINQVFS